MVSALSGLRVVDFSQFVAGPLVTLQLADLGADVVRVDPPGGPRWQHPGAALLLRGKRSIVLDLKNDTDKGIARRLFARADVLVESWRPGVAERLGIGVDDVLAAYPRLVYLSLPGFGHDDPRAAVPGWDGVVAAAAGLYPPKADGEPGEQRFAPLTLSSNFAAMQAAHGVAAALIARERTGRGEWVEVPLFDAAFELLGGGVQMIGDATPPPQGVAAPAHMPQIGHYVCGDGRWVQLCLVQPRHLDWFVRTFLPEHVADGWADADVVREDVAVQQAMRARLAELMATRPAVEWERHINETSKAPTGVSQSTEDWLRRDEHSRDSRAVIAVAGDAEFGDTVQAGYPIALSATPPETRGPRHRLDADRAAVLAELDDLDAQATSPTVEPASSELPLAGIKVVDLSQVLAGPTAGRVLADYGAEVVKINSPEDRQHFQHLYTNAGKRTILLDLKTAGGQQVFGRLLEDADVLIENFTRGVADRLGVGETAVRRVRPEIVYTSVSAFGHDGYRGGYRGREELGQAVTGLQMRWFGADAPRMVFYPLNDYGAGNWAAFATLVALYHRMRTGVGQSTHTSLAHTATFHQAPFMVWYEGRVWDEPTGEVAGWGSLDRIFRAADRWFYLVVADDADRAAVRDATGLFDVDLVAPDTGTIAALEDAFRLRSAGDWVSELTKRGVGAAVVVNQEESMSDEISRARGLSLTRTTPSGQPIRTVGVSPRLFASPLRTAALPNPPGGDLDSVLADLGLAEAAERLVAERAALRELPTDTEFIGRFQGSAGPKT